MKKGSSVVDLEFVSYNSTLHTFKEKVKVIFPFIVSTKRTNSIAKRCLAAFSCFDHEFMTAYSIFNWDFLSLVFLV